MRVLLVGNNTLGHIGWSLRRSLVEMKYELSVMDSGKYFTRRGRSPVHKLIRLVFGHPLAYTSFNRSLTNSALSFQPDIVLVITGRLIRPDTLETIKEETDAILVNYLTDDPFNLQVSTQDLVGGVALYDLIATTKKDTRSDLHAIGCDNVHYVRFAYEPELFYPAQPAPAEQVQWETDVLFVGTYSPIRAVVLEKLARASKQKGYRFRCYGGGWHHLSPSSPLQGFVDSRPLFGRELRLALGCAKIALGFVRWENRDTQTLRTYEIPACGTFMLAARTEDHESLLGEDVGVACFGCPAELLEKVDYYLVHDDQRQRIAEEGHRRITTGGHTFRDRLEEILSLARGISVSERVNLARVEE